MAESRVDGLADPWVLQLEMWRGVKKVVGTVEKQAGMWEFY